MPAGGERIAIEVTDGSAFNEIIVTLEVMFTKLQDMGPAVDAASKAFQGMVETAFSTETSAIDGEKWAALRPSTRKERASQGYKSTHPILQRTGDLKTAAIAAFQPVGGTDRTVFHKTITVIGNDGTNYAANMQYGTGFGRGVGEIKDDVPARPFIPGAGRMTTVLNKKVQQYLFSPTEYTNGLFSTSNNKGKVYNQVSVNGNTAHGKAYKSLVDQNEFLYQELSAVPNFEQNFDSSYFDSFVNNGPF